MNSGQTDAEMNDKLTAFVEKLYQGQFSGSYDRAYATLKILKEIISDTSWSNVQELIATVRKEGERIIQADRTETSVGNMVRRVLKIIWEEDTGHQESDHQESLQKLLLSHNHSANTQEQLSTQRLKEAVLEGINELLSELDTSVYNIAEQAIEYIHNAEVIMTAGKSRTVHAFLKRAAKKIKFQVIVAEHAPFYDGQEMAVNLAKEGIKTTVITDAAVFAVMARVNKVIMGTHAILADGGLKAPSGSHAIALAAKHYSVPVIICSAMFKLCPHYHYSYTQPQEAFNSFVSPNNMLPYSEGKILSKIEINNPVFDYVPPELVTAFVLNIGGHAPSYMYRLLKELYLREDCLLIEEKYFNI